MSLSIHVDGYSGWRANERPMGFELVGVYRRILKDTVAYKMGRH